MVYTTDSVWCLLIIVKPILTIEQSHNIYHWTVVCDLISWGKEQSQTTFYFPADKESVCIRKIGKSK